MPDETTTLFDALLALRMDWEAIAEHYGSTVTSHLRAGLDGSGLRPGELGRVAADVQRFAAASEQLRLCLADVDHLLEIAEEERVSAIRLVPPPVDSGSPQGDSVPF